MDGWDFSQMNTSSKVASEFAWPFLLQCQVPGTVTEEKHKATNSSLFLSNLLSPRVLEKFQRAQQSPDFLLKSRLVSNSSTLCPFYLPCRTQPQHMHKNMGTLMPSLLFSSNLKSLLLTLFPQDWASKQCWYQLFNIASILP